MIVFIGDLHGNPEALFLIASALGLVSDWPVWSARDVTLVITGDVCDRGWNSESIYRTIIDWQVAAPAFGSRVIFLIGNHEVMNVGGFFYYNTPEETASYSGSGGSGITEKITAFSPGGWLFEWLIRQHFIIKEGPFVAAHADYPTDIEGMTLEEVDARSRRLFYAAAEGSAVTDSLLWSREAGMGLQDYSDSLSVFLKDKGAEHWVCGHTPSPAGRIKCGYGGKYYCIDTAMSFLLGRPSALLYDAGKIKAAYTKSGGLVFEDPEFF